MNNFKKDWKFYLISFFSVVFFASLPELLLRLTPPDFTIDFMYEVYYYLIFFILFFVVLLLFFLGLGKGRIKNRAIFLIYFSLLFLATFLLTANWVGDIFLGILKSPMSFPG
jgi:hypothetical protein